jgi:anti-anti-sigma regulatory factor
MRVENAVACLRLIGEIDWDCEPALTQAAADLRRLAPQRLFVDLAEVSFAGATLVNFVVRVVLDLPPTSATVLCRPTQQTSRLLRMTSIESIASSCDQLPDAWLEVQTSAPDHRPDRNVPAPQTTILVPGDGHGTAVLDVARR